MTNTETTVVYYNVKQIINLDGNSTVKLYSDKDRTNVVGQAIYNTTTYNDFRSEDSWSQEFATFYFSGNDTITFDSSSKTKNGVLPAGTYKYSIICGQGKYLGATGTLTFKVTEGGLRIITINANLA
jgi:hypothetical protein